MNFPDFWDFMMEGGYDLLFPDDEEGCYECPSCNQIIDGNEKVEWTNKKNKIFRCPYCDEEIKLK